MRRPIRTIRAIAGSVRRLPTLSVDQRGASSGFGSLGASVDGGIGAIGGGRNAPGCRAAAGPAPTAGWCGSRRHATPRAPPRRRPASAGRTPPRAFPFQHARTMTRRRVEIEIGCRRVDQRSVDDRRGRAVAARHRAIAQEVDGARRPARQREQHARSPLRRTRRACWRRRPTAGASRSAAISSAASGPSSTRCGHARRSGCESRDCSSSAVSAGWPTSTSCRTRVSPPGRADTARRARRARTPGRAALRR